MVSLRIESGFANKNLCDDASLSGNISFFTSPHLISVSFSLVVGCDFFRSSRTNFFAIQLHLPGWYVRFVEAIEFIVACIQIYFCRPFGWILLLLPRDWSMLSVLVKLFSGSPDAFGLSSALEVIFRR